MKRKDELFQHFLDYHIKNYDNEAEEFNKELEKNMYNKDNEPARFIDITIKTNRG